MNNTSRRINTSVPETAAPVPTHFESSIMPSSFMLGGLSIDVAIDNTLLRQEACIGKAVYARQLIAVDAAAAPRQTVEQAFLHEMVHWILFVMNENELRDNEKFVDLFAHFLYQALATAKFSQPAVVELETGGEE